MPTAAAVEVDPALVRQVAGRIERLTVAHKERERADAALALRLQNAELTQGSAVPEEKDDDAAMAARLQRDEAIAYRDARRRLDAWTPGETRTPVARPARSRAGGPRRHREHLRRAQQCINQIVAVVANHGLHATDAPHPLTG